MRRKPKKIIPIFTDPYSLADLVKGAAFKRAVKSIDPHIWNIPEEQLESMCKPTHIDWALKNAFWNEVRLCHIDQKKIDSARVYAGICTYTNWYNGVLKNHRKLRWLIEPANPDSVGTRFALHLIANSFADLVEMPITQNGELALKVVDRKLKVFAALDDFLFKRGFL